MKEMEESPTRTHTAVLLGPDPEQTQVSDDARAVVVWIWSELNEAQ